MAILRRTAPMFTSRALHDVVRDKLLHSERQRHRGLHTSCARHHTTQYEFNGPVAVVFKALLITHDAQDLVCQLYDQWGRC